MTDTAPVQPPAPAPETPPKPETPPRDLAAEVEKWKHLSRQNEAKAKENAEAAKKLADLEEAGKTEMERAQARVAAAEKEAAESTARLLRLEVAFEKGLTAAQAKRLQGATREELEADADEIVRDFPTKTDGRPRGDIGQGPRPPAAVVDPATATGRQLLASAFAADMKNPT